MPSMDEIFDRHADRYDDLIDAEDPEGNLWAELQTICSWLDLRVLEAGAGTGRVTRIATTELVKWVATEYDMDPTDALVWITQVLEIRVGNVCDPNYSIVAAVLREALTP